jgi:voltage-gated potassium channel
VSTIGGTAHLPTLRGRVFDLLDEGVVTRGALLVQRGLIALILVSVAANVLESVPAIEARWAALFAAIEIVSVALFTLEYGARLWSAPEDASLAGRKPWRARLAWILRPQSLVDLAAIAPVYVSLATEADLRSLLILRLFRFFKLARYSPGLATLFETIHAERRALSASLIIFLGTVLIAASAMHLAEGAAQPDKFGTIPDAMYWAFVTLATVGYGDVVPVTPLGKVIASLSAVVGIVMLALPVGILASAFADEIRRRDFVVSWTMVARVPIFAGLEAADLARITRVLLARFCEAGQIVVRKGEPANSMFLITSGLVEVQLHDHPVQLGEGDFFGEMALLHGTRRSATVVAITPVKLLVLEAGDLRVLMDQRPEMGRRIRAIADQRRNEVQLHYDGEGPERLRDAAEE